MARDDWRIRIELPEERHAGALLARLGFELSPAARELARELERHRLAVTQDGNVVFVYAGTLDQASMARTIVDEELKRLEAEPRSLRIEQWLENEDRWDHEAPHPTIEQEVLSRGYAPWEVRVECPSHAEAKELADRLEADGYDVVRRWRYVIVGTASRKDADELAERVHGEVEPGGELVWEVLPQNPFVVFGGLGGTGTPL